MNDFIIDVENKKIKGFYQYSPFKDNCQKWQFDLLNNNDISQFNDFVLQDVDELAPSWLKAVSKGLTNIAGLTDFVIKGGGLTK